MKKIQAAALVALVILDFLNFAQAEALPECHFDGTQPKPEPGYTCVVEIMGDKGREVVWKAEGNGIFRNMNTGRALTSNRGRASNVKVAQLFCPPGMRIPSIADFNSFLADGALGVVSDLKVYRVNTWGDPGEPDVQYETDYDRFWVTDKGVDDFYKMGYDPRRYIYVNRHFRLIRERGGQTYSGGSYFDPKRNQIICVD